MNRGLRVMRSLDGFVWVGEQVDYGSCVYVIHKVHICLPICLVLTKDLERQLYSEGKTNMP